MIFYCKGCWAELEPSLARAASLRCHDCRDGLTEPPGGAHAAAVLRHPVAASAPGGSVSPVTAVDFRAWLFRQEAA